MIFSDRLYERQHWRTQRLDHSAIARACVGVRRNWKNLPPTQRARPVQYFELIDEVSRKGRERGGSWYLLQVVEISEAWAWWEVWILGVEELGLGLGNRTRVIIKQPQQAIFLNIQWLLGETWQCLLSNWETAIENVMWINKERNCCLVSSSLWTQFNLPNSLFRKTVILPILQMGKLRLNLSSVKQLVLIEPRVKPRLLNPCSLSH